MRSGIPAGGESTGGGRSGCAARRSSSGVPHSMQNFASGGGSAPQLGQRRASAVPQDMQKRAASGLAVPQA